MCRTAFELLGCGVLKYTGKGSREFTCVSFENAVKMMGLDLQEAGDPHAGGEGRESASQGSRKFLARAVGQEWPCTSR